jgi:hypothetical protein
MKKMKLLSRCPECGGKVVMRRGRGRLMRYKNIDGLEVPASLGIPTCRDCGTQWINDTVAEAIDEAMEPVYRARLRQMVQAAIATITELVSQSELERKLGMAQGYLTKLKNGRRDPSPELVLQLSLIALSPRRRLQEIDQILAGPQQRSA